MKDLESTYENDTFSLHLSAQSYQTRILRIHTKYAMQ